MITEKHLVDFENTYPLKSLGSLKDIAFFDIETTGFSGVHSQVYLIGCIFFCHDHWEVIQWFADNADSEKELLTAFFTFLKTFKILIHFNGDGFDIPFLLKRCQALGMSQDFSDFTSIDIYKRIRPYRKVLGLDSLKQKSIEHFLGIFRQDIYSGGQLIEVYKDYLINHENSLYEMLMLHNREDLEGMPLILPILLYADFLEQDFVLEDQHILKQPDIFGEMTYNLCLTLKSPVSVPADISWETPYAVCQASQNFLTLTIELVKDTLKFFYPDYKNYYYLIYEDTAIHKSIGEFVEKEARKKATAQTCYTKKSSLFLPQPEGLWTPSFRKSYRAKQLYAEYQPDLLNTQENIATFIHYILDF